MMRETVSYNTENNSRLGAAAEYVAARLSFEKPDTPLICADVGADHAYLSIYLAESGICRRVYATEINKGPCEKARLNIMSRRPIEVLYEDGSKVSVPLSEIVTVHNVDGLDTMENRMINRIVICGMGGEVISGILDRAPFVRDGNIKLVLQPMSREFELRTYLAENGFSIIDEKLVSDAGRVYAVISAVWDGRVREFSPSELILGKRIIDCGGELFRSLLKRKLLHAKNRMKDSSRTEFDERLFGELTALCKREHIEV